MVERSNHHIIRANPAPCSIHEIAVLYFEWLVGPDGSFCLEDMKLLKQVVSFLELYTFSAQELNCFGVVKKERDFGDFVNLFESAVEII